MMQGHHSWRSLLRRWWWPATALAVFPIVAWARVRSSSVIETNLLRSNDTPAALSTPIRKPYFLGWSAEVSPASGLFQSTNEYGGIAIDLRGKGIYAGTRKGELVCLGPGGDVRWRVQLGGEVLAPPTVYNDLVLVGTSEGVLHILNKVTGARIARGILGEQLITQPEVVDFGQGVHRVFVGSGAESLFAVDLDTGQKLWRAHREIPSGFTVFGFAKPVVLQDAVYIGYADGYVEARDPATGSLKWERHVSPEGDLQDIDGLATNGRELFAASYSGGIFALDLNSGSVKWQKPMPRASRVQADGSVIYAGAPGLWQGMRGSDGAITWRFHFQDEATTAGALAGEQYLTFAIAGGPVYFIDKYTGQPTGQFATGEGFSSPPAAVGPAMAVLSNGGRVYTMVAVPQ